jgi:hypothetical protein
MNTEACCYKTAVKILSKFFSALKALSAVKEEGREKQFRRWPAAFFCPLLLCC